MDTTQGGTARFTVVEGMRVRYAREGSGPVVLLLHGSGSSLDAYDAVTARLRTSFDVIRPDLPGCGLTGPRPDRDYRIAAYTRFVAGFLDDQDVRACTLVGHSLGGNIAWNFALDHPARTTGLVLLNATGYPGKTLPLAMRLARTP
ncbi:alpha/beta fold hydrolase [Streptomyces sp. GMY02]|uniref:alpha/beta fold hydrolase n=1 Tax=Streptomyces sp. GMY02 TaxID=1333528 RepID=UPI00349F75EC